MSWHTYNVYTFVSYMGILHPEEHFTQVYKQCDRHWLCCCYTIIILIRKIASFRVKNPLNHSVIIILKSHKQSAIIALFVSTTLIRISSCFRNWFIVTNNLSINFLPYRLLGLNPTDCTLCAKVWRYLNRIYKSHFKFQIFGWWWTVFGL